MRRLHLSLLLIVGAACASLGPSCCSVLAHEGPTIVVREAPPSFNAEHFQAVIRHLTEHAPLNAPALIQVRRIPEPVWGRCSWREDQGAYFIEIEAAQPYHAILDTLIHEWAHAMVWDASPIACEAGDAAHGPLWGVAQARAYVLALAASEELAALQDAPDEPQEAGEPEGD
jgi:hypothetical protein